MKKGFTLVELLAVISIITLLLLIAIPIYTNVEKSIKESVYETKLKNVLATAESYASETGSFVFDIKTLISNGLLEADNELGEYLDPRTNKKIECNILNVVMKENQYYANMIESEKCYEKEELESIYGLGEILLFKDNQEIKEENGWVTGHQIKAEFRLKEQYKDYEPFIEEILWTGEEPKKCTKSNKEDCKRYAIVTEEIKNITLSLQIKVVINSNEMNNTIKKTINIDNQSPYVIDGSIIQNVEVNTQGNRKVEFDLSDGNGSGLKDYAIITGKDCNLLEYEEKKTNVDNAHVTAYLANGIYTICARDHMNNKSESTSSFTVSSVDTTKPLISNFTINSKEEKYNSLNVRLSIKASDDMGDSNLKMCISNVGYLKGCSWEAYQEGKDWTMSGTLDGKPRIVYLSIQDNSGNITERTAEYIPLKECVSTSKKDYSEWSTCTKSCGGGTRKRSYNNRDNYTNNVCSSDVEEQLCNTQSCCSSTVDYQVDAWGSCSKTCGGGTQSRTIHKKSVYDGSYCGSYQQSQSCNTQSCCSSTVDYQVDAWGSCSKTCGGGIQYRTIHKKSTYDGSYCGSYQQSQNCNKQSCELIIYDNKLYPGYSFNIQYRTDRDAEIYEQKYTVYDPSVAGNSREEMRLVFHSHDNLYGGFLLSYLNTPIDLTNYSEFIVEYYVPRGAHFRIGIRTASRLGSYEIYKDDEGDERVSEWNYAQEPALEFYNSKNSLDPRGTFVLDVSGYKGYYYLTFEVHGSRYVSGNSDTHYVGRADALKIMLK